MTVDTTKIHVLQYRYVLRTTCTTRVHVLPVHELPSAPEACSDAAGREVAG